MPGSWNQIAEWLRQIDELLACDMDAEKRAPPNSLPQRIGAPIRRKRMIFLEGTDKCAQC
jgi:hypothetical protein